MPTRIPSVKEQRVLVEIMNGIDKTLDLLQMPLAVRISLLGSLLLAKIAELSVIDHPVAVLTATKHADVLSTMALTKTPEQLALVLQLQHREATGTGVREQ